MEHMDLQARDAAVFDVTRDPKRSPDVSVSRQKITPIARRGQGFVVPTRSLRPTAREESVLLEVHCPSSVIPHYFFLSNR
jgi:hypothetical protein